MTPRELANGILADHAAAMAVVAPAEILPEEALEKIAGATMSMFASQGDMIRWMKRTASQGLWAAQRQAERIAEEDAREEAFNNGQFGVGA